MSTQARPRTGALSSNTALRWALVPVASMAGCSGSVFLADAAGGVARRMISPDAGSRMEAIIPVDVRAGLVYAIAAAAWVVAGSRVAPSRRAVVAVILFAAGAWLAGWGLNDWYFPEGHPRAYQRSRIPLVLTLLGGLAGTAAVIARRRRTPEGTS